jgi:hypothetical protein
VASNARVKSRGYVLDKTTTKELAGFFHPPSERTPIVEPLSLARDGDTAQASLHLRFFVVLCIRAAD